MLDYYTSSIISCSIVCVCVGVLVGFELQDLGQFLLIDQTLIPDKLKSGYVGNQSSSKLPRAGLALCSGKWSRSGPPYCIFVSRRGLAADA
jgi:hypothetical protein